MPVNVTVNAARPHVQYVADGTQAEFGFPFVIFTAADLQVYLDGVLQTEGFSIEINPQSSVVASGGVVRFDHTPAAQTQLTLRRQVTIQRKTNFQESGELRARTLNFELDNLTAAVQQIEDLLSGTVRLHPADVDATLSLPLKADRAGKALGFDSEGNIAVGTFQQADEITPQTLDDISSGTVNTHFTVADKQKLDGISERAQINPVDLDGVADSSSRLAMTVDERAKLATVASDAEANPPAATTAEVIAGTEVALRSHSPAQIKAAVTTHAPVTSVAGRSGAVSLSQTDVAGTVPTTTQISAGVGLIGGGDLSGDRSLAVDFPPAGDIAGIATSVARADHIHAPATETDDGLLSAGDKAKLDGIANNAEANPLAATTAEVIAGTEIALRSHSPAQIKAAVTTHAPVTSVAGRSGAVSLSQTDVAGTVPTARQINTGAGLIGGGDLSNDRSLAVDLAPTSSIAGTASSVARSDHTHAPASQTADGLLSADDKTKLDGIANKADANPPAASAAELTAGTEVAARTLSPAQIKAAVTTHAPVSSVAGRTGAVALSQTDVPGTVPTTRQLSVGAGLTGGGNLSANRAFAVDFTAAGVGTNGAATTVARSDHGHGVASAIAAGFMSAGDKAKLDGIANSAEANPPAATAVEITAGTEVALRSLSPAQVKAAVTTHAPVAPVASVAGRTGAISLSQPDVAGTVPTTTQISAGTGLTGGGDLSASRTLTVNFAASGVGSNGTALTVARSDHGHGVASATAPGFMSAGDKAKLDGVANNAEANPLAATTAELTAGTEVALRSLSPAQVKAAVTTHAPVAPVSSVAGRTGAVSLSQTDVAGTVPTARQISAGVGLIGGGDLSSDRSIAINFASSGGTNGTATTIARGDHGHIAATSAANGYMTAADKSKLDGIEADSEWRDFSTIWSGSTSQTNPTANTIFYPASSNGSRAPVSFVGVSQVKLVCLTGSGTSNLRAMIEVSTDGGANYKLPDGSSFAGASATSVANVEAFGPCILSDANGPNELLITIPAWLQQSGVMVRGFAYDSVGGNNRTVNRMVLKVQRHVVYAGNPIKEKDIVAGAGVAGPVSPKLLQKMQDIRRYGVPDLYFPGKTVKDLTRDFGDYNLSANVTDPYSETSIGLATDDVTKFRAIMASLTSKTQLVLPTGRFVRVGGPVWCANNVDLVTPGARGSAGICNKGPNFYDGQAITFGTQGNSSFTEFTGWRLASGVGGRSDILAGDVAIRCQATEDYNYIVPGTNTAQIVLVGGNQYYYSALDGFYKPVERITFEVIDKDIVGGERLLYLDEPVPYDFSAAPNATHGYKYSGPTGPINGCAFIALYDLVPTGTGTKPSFGFHATNVSLHNLLIVSTKSHAMANLPRNGLFQNCIIFSSKTGIYGNCPQNLTMENCHFVFGRDLMEVSMAGYNFRATGCSAEWNNDTTYGGSTSGNAMSFQECTRDSIVENLIIEMGAWNPDPTNTQIIMRSTGHNNKYRGITVNCAADNMMAIYTSQEGSTAPYASSNEFRDIKVTNTSTTQTKNLISINGTDHKVRGAKLVVTSPASNDNTIGATAARTVFEDIQTPEIGVNVNAAATGCRINRCDPMGTVVNNGGAAVISGTPNFNLHKVPGANWGALTP